jgi:hypothetical protein
MVPTSFTELLAACGIAADDAYKLALAIRDRIMNSFDEIWRERNIKQHKPNLRKAIRGSFDQGDLGHSLFRNKEAV